MPPYRRVVTGLNEAGRSCVIFDGPGGILAGEGVTTRLLWQSDEAPASNEGNEEGAREPSSFKLPPGGNKFVIVEFPPGEGLGEDLALDAEQGGAEQLEEAAVVVQR